MKNDIKNLLLVNDFTILDKEDLPIYKIMIEKEIKKLKNIDTTNNERINLKSKNIQRISNLCMFFNVIKELEKKLKDVIDILNN